jgi:predicted DNA-binding ribbon-helix-helix protein
MAPPRQRKHSVTIAGHRTSISLEDAFWRQLKRIAAEENRSLNALVRDIDSRRAAGEGLSSALRLHVLNHLLQQLGRLTGD